MEDLGASLVKGVRQTIVRGEVKDVNMKAQDRHHKYLHKIQSFCDDHTDETIAEVSGKYDASRVTPEFLNTL